MLRDGLTEGSGWLFTILVLLALSGCVHPQGFSDKAWYDLPGDEAPSARRYKGSVRSWQYLLMRDGVKIAIDLYLPQGLSQGEKIPTILHLTRYVRAFETRWLFRLLLRGRPYVPFVNKTQDAFVRHGYAWVSVDVRGSGASYGTRPCPWSQDEVEDGAEIVDWVLKQPWSNGKVGATGISYVGYSALFLLLNHHPAVKAIAPSGYGFDNYTDVAFPGGILKNGRQ